MFKLSQNQKHKIYYINKKSYSEHLAGIGNIEGIIVMFTHRRSWLGDLESMSLVVSLLNYKNIQLYLR